MHVLRDLIAGNQNSEYNYLLTYTEDQANGYHHSPQAYNAIAEAVAWLRARGMIAHRPLDNRPASILITRYGREMAESDLGNVRATERLQSNLHLKIQSRARRQFMLGEYETAIFVSMKAIEVRVRELGGFSNEVIGVDLMRKAFRVEGPLADPAAPRGEVEGTMMLFAGAFAVLRNPSGHREVEFDDVTEASEAVMTASMLMRILDRVEHRISSSSQEVQS